LLWPPPLGYEVGLCACLEHKLPWCIENTSQEDGLFSRFSSNRMSILLCHIFMLSFRSCERFTLSSSSRRVCRMIRSSQLPLARSSLLLFYFIFSHFLLFRLQYFLQGIKTLVPKLCHMLDPAFQFTHGIRIDLVDALLRSFFHTHHIGLTEHFEM